MHIANNILKRSLQNVYFLVGTACGGKTTMANALAIKYGFIHFNDNWHEENFKVWQTIVEEKYQPNATKRKEIDWEEYFSRSPEEFLADKSDNHGAGEQLEFSIIELIKLSQHSKVVADVWIEDMSLLMELSDPSRIACLLAPGELIIRDYYTREDHIEFTQCIQSLTDPEKKFETQNELFRIGARDMAEKVKKHGLFSIMRSDESTVEGTLKLLEDHFHLEAPTIRKPPGICSFTPQD